MPNDDSETSLSRPIMILLVDDHPHVRKLLREMIEMYDENRRGSRQWRGSGAFSPAILSAVKRVKNPVYRSELFAHVSNVGVASVRESLRGPAIAVSDLGVLCEVVTSE